MTYLQSKPIPVSSSTSSMMSSSSSSPMSRQVPAVYYPYETIRHTLENKRTILETFSILKRWVFNSVWAILFPPNLFTKILNDPSNLDFSIEMIYWYIEMFKMMVRIPPFQFITHQRVQGMFDLYWYWLWKVNDCIENWDGKITFFFSIPVTSLPWTYFRWTRQ